MRWRDLIFHNLWLKLFSLLLAMLVWFAARTQLAENPVVPAAFSANDAQRDFDRTVLVLTPPTDSRVFRVDPPNVTVTVSGPASLVQELTEGKVDVFVSAPGPGVNAEPVPIEVVVPKGITVVQTRPAAAMVREIDLAKPDPRKTEETKP
jgi:hypothetical protein